jgi:predicted alpha/beta-hydrolase family hydrolase
MRSTGCGSGSVPEVSFTAGGARLHALFLRPEGARLLYVVAHGAGAGMRHPFLEAIAEALAEEGVASFRYEFPYMQDGRKRPDASEVLHGTVRAAVVAAQEAAPDLPLIAGGKSFGGRMTTQSQADAPLPGIRGIALLGFPLHPAGAPSVKRAEHLPRVMAPLLFLQGTRDELADLSLLRPIVEKLPGAHLHIVEGADHSFHVLKRSARTDADVLRELARAVAEWGSGL